MKENLKTLGQLVVFFGVAMLCLWGLLVVAKGLEDRSLECNARGGEMLHYRCIEIIELEGK